MDANYKNTAMTCIQHAYWRLVGNDLESTARFLKEATVAINKARMDAGRCPECGATKCCYECASQGGPGTTLMEADDGR